MDMLQKIFTSFVFLFLVCKFSYASDTITSFQSLSDGRTLVSNGGTFELGFFSPGSSKNRYLGIWYHKIPVQTVVWVANRLKPINDSSGLLMINSTGNLVLMSQNKSVVWSATLRKQIQSPVVLQLLDSGNLVLRDEQDGHLGSILWQSSDYPSDTLLPDMKLGWDLKTGLERRLSAWRSPDDPSPGDFSLGVELKDNPQLVMRKGSKKFYRSGLWTGLGISGAPELRPNPFFNYSFVLNEEEVYYKFSATDKSILARNFLNQTSNRHERVVWNEADQNWNLYSYAPRDYCDNFGLCGAYGVCILSESPICQCLEGFEHKSGEGLNWSQGCIRSKPLNYSKTDGFVKFRQMKLPDATHSWVNRSMNLKECREKCLENSSCMAYSNSNTIGEGSGCAMWFGDLIDMRELPDSGQDLYIRMSASELGKKYEHMTRRVVIVTSAIVAVAGVLLIVIMSRYIHKSRIKAAAKTKNNGETDQQNDLELPLFKFGEIVNATSNFSIRNKLGEGGFGPVYKGTLLDGKEIAVKRLSNISGQGINEFKNEVRLIANLQHRNLVKLLGSCIQGEEKMLIYEFMPNKSLDFFIFDHTRSKLLDWSKRFQIIGGISRGLLYLHQDSRLRIIHRDLKASNILLDHQLNPKISDFGLARTFGGDQTEGNTRRVVGTYGYMAPEYAIDGLFSIKSDVFSFGILMLEIITGSRNRGFYHPDYNLSLLGYAWKLWKEGKALELIDSFLEESCDNLSEVKRCIHIGLLCVQQYPEDRPSMSSVVLMLGSDRVLPQPKEPGFLIDRNSLQPEFSTSKRESSSTNHVTISLLEGR